MLGEICREKGWLSLPEAIHKITLAPARRIGLSNRGQLAPDHIADITVYDPSPSEHPPPMRTPLFHLTESNSSSSRAAP
ncbi:amidohydrolase family protein [Edaphobacter bradus]|uniref:amidohydrolase family protein n=1 Tax=Edaphobacter bradus TaxID=2259016 RepID=UPI0037C00A67